MKYYAVIVKDTGEIIKDNNGNLVTFLSKPDVTFNFSSIELSEDQIELTINQKLNNGVQNRNKRTQRF